jgi:UrcA family protein
VKSAKRFCSMAIILATLATGATATAEEQPPQRVVFYGDLSLDTPAGVKTLYGRLRSAAEIVCHASRIDPLAFYRKTRLCVNGSMDRAVTDVDAPLLTSYHNDQTRRTRAAYASVASHS